MRNVVGGVVNRFFGAASSSLMTAAATYDGRLDKNAACEVSTFMMMKGHGSGVLVDLNSK